MSSIFALGTTMSIQDPQISVHAVNKIQEQTLKITRQIMLSNRNDILKISAQEKQENC
jgi:hypothetical protein